jgi:hypothetical protein
MFIPFFQRASTFRRFRPTLELLETRLQPSVNPYPPVLVNPGNPATGTDPGMENPYAPPNVAVAQNAAGGFVEVWFSTANGNEILAQRFDAVGNPLGHQMTIVSNHAPETSNPIPAVGMDSAGNFVVAFDTSSGIFASRFSSAGISLDHSPFQVDTHSNSFEDSNPSVALDDHGHFVISYIGFNSSGAGVFAQQGFDSGATTLTASATTVAHSAFSSFVFYQSASVSADATGNFVVAFEAVSFFSTSSSSVYAQRYDSSASALGSAIAVSTSGVAEAPSVAVNHSSGEFAVTWVEASAIPVVMAETYHANGSTRAAPFSVSPAGDPPSTQTYDTPTVAASPTGAFVVVWAAHNASSENTEPTGNLYAQTFNEAGSLSGSTIVISSQRKAPGPISVAMDAAGNFVVGYVTSEQTVQGNAGVSASGNRYDISAAIFRPPTITACTANLTMSAPSIVIHGYGFSTTPANNIIFFSNGAVGRVIASTSTTLIVVIIKPPTTAGKLTAVVRTNGVSSGNPVQVATILPNPAKPVVVTPPNPPGPRFGR